MTICRKCGTSNQDSRKFCVFCHELLVADPVEMEKRAAVLQKKQQKEQKKLDAKHKRWKKALFMLIPIGVLDLIDLFLCLDVAFIGLGEAVGSLLGGLLSNLTGPTLELFNNLVYTDLFMIYVVRALEVLGAFGILLVACILTVIMIVRLIRWRVYLKQGDKKERLLAQTVLERAQEDSVRGQQAANVPVQEFETESVSVAMGAKVSYATLAKAYEQKDSYVMPKPESEMELAALYKALRAQLWEYDEDSVRRILSAMSASRLLLCSAGAVDRADVFEHLCRALDVGAVQYTCPESEQEQAEGIARVLLQYDEQTGVPEHTSFARALYTARFSQENVCLAGVSGIGAAEVEATFAPLRSYYKLPQCKVVLDLGKPLEEGVACPADISGGKMQLSPNVWTLSILPENDRASDVGAAMGQYCTALYLRNSQNMVPPEEAEHARAFTLSVQAWERAVAAAEDSYYISDELWAVIDLIEQRMLDAGGSRLTNRTLRSFEKYVATFMACGGKQNDAFDNGFAAVIIPACAEQLCAVADRAEGESFAVMLERTVGREKLPVTVEALSAMGLI